MTMNTDLELASGRSVADVLGALDLEDEGREILEGAPDLKAGVQALVDGERFADAVAVLAHALPDREGVGWAWVCAREATPKDSPDEIEGVLKATRAWIQDPSEEARRAAMAASEAAGLETSAGFTGLAAFFCGESIGPPDLDPVPPPQGMVGTLVTACIAIAAAEGEPEEVEGQLSRFAGRGMELAERIRLWPDPGDSGDDSA